MGLLKKIKKSAKKRTSKLKKATRSIAKKPKKVLATLGRAPKRTISKIKRTSSTLKRKTGKTAKKGVKFAKQQMNIKTSLASKGLDKLTGKKGTVTMLGNQATGGIIKKDGTLDSSKAGKLAANEILGEAKIKELKALRDSFTSDPVNAIATNASKVGSAARSFGKAPESASLGNRSVASAAIDPVESVNEKEKKGIGKFIAEKPVESAGILIGLLTLLSRFVKFK